MRRVVSSVVLLLVAAAFIATAYRYDARSAEFPLIVGWATLVLCAVDLFACTPTRAGEWLTSFLHRPRAVLDEDCLSPPREAAGMLWVAAMVALVWLFGFLIAIPIYVIAFMILQGRRPLISAVVAAGVTTVLVYVVFEWLLRHELYRGLLFG